MNPATAVRVVDRIVLPVDRAESWLTFWRSDYLPGATARGLRAPQVLREYTGTDSVAVQIVWELPGIYDFYGMRGAAAGDPSVAAFWSDTDAVAVTRERHVLAVQEEKP
ncbi:hypothetical protein [Nocardia heshunensis]